MKWQLIETAPHDGSPVLVWNPEWVGPCIMIWSMNDIVGYECWYVGGEDEPTHWLPLPKLPALPLTAREIR